ncbi:MAG: response regulator [Propionibacterium sp.]|nr:MAG: response regulator [Propionibacterium sp.]
MSDDSLKVLLYSNDRTVREQVRLALGRKVAADLPELEIEEVATHQAVVKAMDTGEYDLAIFDGEANPGGGFGLAYQMKDEIVNCPPIMLLVIRAADAWLGTWSRAEALVPMPIDPMSFPAQVAEVLRKSMQVEVN